MSTGHIWILKGSWCKWECWLHKELHVYVLTRINLLQNEGLNVNQERAELEYIFTFRNLRLSYLFPLSFFIHFMSTEYLSEKLQNNSLNSRAILVHLFGFIAIVLFFHTTGGVGNLFTIIFILDQILWGHLSRKVADIVMAIKDDSLNSMLWYSIVWYT